MMPLTKTALAVGIALTWPTGAAAQAEDPVAFELAVDRVVEELGPHIVPMVDPRPVSPSLELFSEGLPAHFVEEPGHVAERRRVWLGEMGVAVGDAVVGSRCWATPMLLVVAGQEPDSAVVRATEERESRCLDHASDDVYLVLSLPRAGAEGGGVEYRVVGYGNGCVWGWDVVVGRDRGDVELSGGIDTCT